MTPAKIQAIFLVVMALLFLGAMIELLRTTPTGRAWLAVIALCTFAAVVMGGKLIVTGSLP